MGKLITGWKDAIQIAGIAFVAGGMVYQNAMYGVRVEKLELSDVEKTRAILIIEERYENLKRDNQELKGMIQKLQDKLEAKKIVNLASDNPPIVGENYVELWQP